jgi:predicted exporter/SAM-dependent methyltransferase
MTGGRTAAFFARLPARRSLILVSTGLLAGFSLLVSTQLVLEENIAVMLPEGDPQAENLQEAMARFRQANRLLVEVSSEDAGTFSRDALLAAADDCHARLRTVPGVAAVDYRHDADSLLPLMQVFLERAPLLLTPRDLAELETRLEPGRLARRLAWFKERMGTPQGLALKDIPAQDPAGVRDVILERLRSMLSGFGLSPTDGRLISADGRHVLMLVESGFPSSDSRSGAPFIRAILEAGRAVEARHAAAGVRVRVAGAHRVGVDNAAMIRSDARRTVLIGLGAMLAVCLLAYRRPWLALLTFLPTAFGVLAAGGILALVNPHLSAIAVGCASMLAGIGVDYAVHVLYHLDERGGRTAADRGRILARLALPIGIGLLTTMAAFLVMLGSSVPGHRQMGWFGCLSMAGSAAFALLILPLLVPVNNRSDAAAAGPPVAGAAPELRLTRAMASFFEWRARRAGVLLAALALLGVGAAFGWPRLVFDGDFFNLNGIFPETRQAEEDIRRVWGDFTRLTLVVVKAADREQAWQKAERVTDALRGPPDAGRPSALMSVADLCPSRAAQERNLAAWRAFWTPARRERLAADLSAAASGLGYRPEPLAARVAGLGREPLEPGALTPDDPALREWLAGRVSSRNGDVRLVLAARVPGEGDIAAFERRVREAVPDAAVLDNRLFAAHLAGLTRRGLSLFAAVSTLAVAAVLFLLLGRPGLVAAALLPLAAGVGLAFGCLGWLGVSLNLANIVFVIFLIGVGIDYSVFLVTSRLAQHRGAGETLSAAGGSVLVCVLTTLAGFGALALARHPALWSIGWTALPGMVCVLASTYVLTPWLMDRLLAAAPRPAAPVSDAAARRRAVRRLYRYQGLVVEQFVYWKLRTDPMFRLLDALVPERGLILDLGCGHGLVAHWLALGAAGRTVTGVDFDEEKLAVARRACADPVRVRFESGDIRSWSGPAADAVLMLDVLHYWRPDQQAELLARARALLRPGGRLILREGIAGEAGAGRRRTAFWERFAVAIGHNRRGEGWHYPRLSELDAALRRAGFAPPTIQPGGGSGANRLLVALAV